MKSSSLIDFDIENAPCNSSDSLLPIVASMLPWACISDSLISMDLSFEYNIPIQSPDQKTSISRNRPAWSAPKTSVEKGLIRPNTDWYSGRTLYATEAVSNTQSNIFTILAGRALSQIQYTCGYTFYEYSIMELIREPEMSQIQKVLLIQVKPSSGLIPLAH